MRRGNHLRTSHAPTTPEKSGRLSSAVENSHTDVIDTEHMKSDHRKATDFTVFLKAWVGFRLGMTRHTQIKPLSAVPSLHLSPKPLLIIFFVCLFSAL